MILADNSVVIRKTHIMNGVKWKDTTKAENVQSTSVKRQNSLAKLEEVAVKVHLKVAGLF